MKGKYCFFGELKAGDKFIFNGYKYEKISGCYADCINFDTYDVMNTIEFTSKIKVFLLLDI